MPYALCLRTQHGPISHPYKIPSKHWVLKICGRNSKEHNYHRSREQVADQIISLHSSEYSSRKEKGYRQVQHRIHGRPVSRRLNDFPAGL